MLAKIKNKTRLRRLIALQYDGNNINKLGLKSQLALMLFLSTFDHYFEEKAVQQAV